MHMCLILRINNRKSKHVTVFCYQRHIQQERDGETETMAIHHPCADSRLLLPTSISQSADAFLLALEAKQAAARLQER
jgi:hypothetical protein